MQESNWNIGIAGKKSGIKGMQERNWNKGECKQEVAIKENVENKIKGS